MKNFSTFVRERGGDLKDNFHKPSFRLTNETDGDIGVGHEVACKEVTVKPPTVFYALWRRSYFDSRECFHISQKIL